MIFLEDYLTIPIINNAFISLDYWSFIHFITGCLFGYFLGVVIGGKHVKMPFDLAYVLMVSVIGTVEQYLEPHQFTNSSSIPSVTIDLEPNMDIIVRDFLSQDAQYVQ